MTAQPPCPRPTASRNLAVEGPATAEVSALRDASRTRNLERLSVVSVMDELCADTPFTKLTVTAICDAAGISRTSFYRLFEDKYEATNWFVHAVSRIGHVQTGRTLSWHDASVATLSGLVLMKNLLASTAGCDGYNSSENTGIRLRTSSLTQTAARRLGREPDEELGFQICFFARSEVPMVREWYRETDARPVEAMARIVESCVPPRLHDLLQLPDDPAKGRELTYKRLVTMF